MKKLFYLLLFFNLGSFAQEASLFEQGNAAYAEGDYAEAVEKYNQILETGKTAAAVHYNLGNAHYKLNHIAPSIYHFEKALQLDPKDDDIRNNLAFAENMTIDAIEENPKIGFEKWKSSILNIFSASGWAWMGIICMLLFVGLFIAYYFSGKPSQKRLFWILGGIFLLLSITSVFLGFSQKEIQENSSFAIVFAEVAEIKSEPNERGSEVFVLHEGAKVRVLEDFQEWTKIEIANGNQGWISESAIKKL
ncbi:MAG TPA: tetratricopeptide repeat protein [Salinimicrobium sp.]|nr:tetratricopeptide repeat protein [Salinimicrobium sp.]